MTTLSYEKIMLGNGVRLITIPMSGVNSIATSVMVGVGSRYETPETNGASHFLEHMVFKGTDKYPTTEEVNAIERVGGLQNAYTDVDITNYHNKVLAEDWELGLNINTELALHPRLDPKYLDTERDVILEEMKRYDDEPSAKVGELFHSMMYPGTRLGMRIIGEVESLKHIDVEVLRSYHRDWYRPNRLVVVLSGSIEKYESAMKEKVETWFGASGGLSPEYKEAVSDTQSGPQLSVLRKPDAQQAHLTLGVRTFRRGSGERFPWSLYNLIMGVSFTSRLFKEVREKRGLCYHIRSSSDNWSDVGYWSVYAGVATQKVEEAIRAILHELSLAVEKGITDEELVVAKKRMKTMFAFKSEDPEFLGEFYGRQELFGEPVMTTDEYLAKLDAVTKDEINALVQTYCIQKNLNLSLVWNKEGSDHLKDLLRL